MGLMGARNRRCSGLEPVFQLHYILHVWRFGTDARLYKQYAVEETVFSTLVVTRICGRSTKSRVKITRVPSSATPPPSPSYVRQWTTRLKSGS